MSKKQYKAIAYAVALATSISTVPHIAFGAGIGIGSGGSVVTDAQGTASQPAGSGGMENMGADFNKTAGEEALDKATATEEVSETPAAPTGASPSAQDEKVQAWQQTRPTEQAIQEYMTPFEGKTVVAVQLEGASETTEPTAKMAVSLHAGDTFTAAAVEQDITDLSNTGYFYDLYPSFETVPEGVVVTYHLLENPTLTDVVFIGNTKESTEELQKLLTVRTGAILNNVQLHQDISAIQEQYRKDGFVLAKVVDMNIDQDGILALKINEGILEGYAVSGNKKTKDKVILREMRQKPGEPFDAKLARRSVQRVYNLGFFEDVNVKMNPGVEPNAVIMEIEVKEKRTGTFGLGAGYSSEDGVIGMVSLSDTNFRGMGESVSVTYEMSGNDTDAHGYTFSFRKPWLDSKETALSLRIYNRTYDYDDYDENGHLKEEYMRKYSGGEITISRPVSEYSTNYLTFRNRKDGYVKHISSGRAGNRSTPQWADWRHDNFGTTRSIILEHVTDTRDDIYNPTTGGKVDLSVEVAGFMGGDFDFQKYTIDDQRFRKVGHAQVLAFHAMYGFGHGKISEFNQYRLGGQNSIRGYRDAQFRGDRAFLATVEYRFPLIKKVQGAIFTDWGGVWDTGFWPKKPHGSIGAGIAVSTPLGALRLDYGYGSQGGRAHFSVGGSF